MEGALLNDGQRGWRANEPGIQTIRLLFDHPQTIRVVRVVFKEEESARTQEFVLRWLPEGDGVPALSLAIFVPKCCDIGAYFTGRVLGCHRMSPILSPKKTWEGLAGGLTAAILVAVGLNRYKAVLPNDLVAAGFGLTVGVAGVLGDLAESLIKRDCRQKDASQVVPGFGGVLDVVDSVVYAAPVVYLWLG